MRSQPIWNRLRPILICDGPSEEEARTDLHDALTRLCPALPPKVALFILLSMLVEISVVEDVLRLQANLKVPRPLQRIKEISSATWHR